MNVTNFVYKPYPKKEKEVTVKVGSRNWRSFGKASFELNGELVEKTCYETDDSYYTPLDEDNGLKLIKDNPQRYGSLQNSYDSLTFMKERSPKGFSKIKDLYFHENNLFIKVNREKENDLGFSVPAWIPPQDIKTFSEYLQASLDSINDINNSIIKNNLLPEDEWCKKTNIINGKLVDYHRFKRFEDRYQIPTTTDVETCEKIYNNALQRYKNMNQTNLKWKGKIYQGYKFSNGVIFNGYSSDKKNFDSYRKLGFYYINKAKNKNVLDIGSNQGFFSTQASLHGAKSVTGIELCKEDYLLACEIRDKITKLSNIEYINGDAVKFVESNKKQYGLTFLSSVLHQIYPDMKGSEQFMKNIAQNTAYLCYETPMNHPLMKIPLKQVISNLQRYFRSTRIVYAYDAYSSGYRCIIICCHGASRIKKLNKTNGL